MSKLKITLIKSPIAAVPKQRANVAALGLRKVGQSVEHPDNKAVRGMIQRSLYMLKVEEI